MKKNCPISFFLLIAVCLLLVNSLQANSLVDDLGLHSTAAQEASKGSCLPLPPTPEAAHHSSAEGMPPLPLPAVALRRTEKKNPPRPPVLITKLSTKKNSDWATNPGDAKNLLRWMAREMDVHFSDMILSVDAIPDQPLSAPLLYRTGHDAFQFTPAQREKLARYLRMGGTLVFESCCGRAEFVESALREISLILPERPAYRLPLEHPLFRSYHTLGQFKFRPAALQAGARPDEPGIIGVDLECRTAIFLFRWDVSCGWDEQKDNDRHHCLGYEIDTARKLGANLLCYVTAERTAAQKNLAQARLFTDATQDTAGAFTIAQVQYHGFWKTRESALSMLLHCFYQKTHTPVSFQRHEVALDSPQLFNYPLLYLTGHQEFIFTKEESAALSRYLRQGGILFAESCCGRENFTHSFLRELKRALPEAELIRLSPQHPLFSYPNQIRQLQARPVLAARRRQALVPPELYAVMLDGHIAVIFSPLGLSCGWEMGNCPYCNGIEQQDALQLGINILSAALLQ